MMRPAVHTRRSRPRRGRRGFCLVALAVVFLLVTGCTRAPGKTNGRVIAFTGGRLVVPDGAVPADKDVVVRTDPPLTAASGGPVHLIGPAVRVEAAGAQPLRPLQLEIAVPEGQVPAQAEDGAIVLLTTSTATDKPQLVDATYDSTAHLIRAQINHLSLFQPAWVDITALARQVTDAVASEVLHVRAQKPSCTASTARLPDGRDAVFDPGSVLTGTDPELWGCLNAAPDGGVDVTVTNNRPTNFSFLVPDGAQLVPVPPTFSESNVRLLYDVVNAGAVSARKIATTGQSVRLRFPVERLPARLSLVVDPSLFLAVATEVAVMKAVPALIGGLPDLEDLLDAPDNLDCLRAALNTGLDRPPALADAASTAFSLGLKCYTLIVQSSPSLAKTGLRALLGLVGLVAAATGAFVSGVDTLSRLLLGTGVLTVGVITKKAPAASSATFD